MTAGARRPGAAHVVIMCGVAGSGKTTFAQRLEAEGYVRLSIDEEVWNRFGRYGTDYPAENYAEHSAFAESVLRDRLVSLIKRGRNVVVDFSFWQRATRDLYKQLIEDAGGRWSLLYLAADPAVLCQRLADRSHRCDANAAFPITDDILTSYLSSFEEPSGEGEEAISSPFTRDSRQ